VSNSAVHFPVAASHRHAARRRDIAGADGFQPESRRNAFVCKDLAKADSHSLTRRMEDGVVANHLRLERRLTDAARLFHGFAH